MNKKVVLAVAASMVLAGTLSAKVYATVNGDDITEKDIALIVKDARVDVSTLPQDVQKQILTQTIDAKLLEQEAMKSDVVSSSEYKENLAKLKSKLALDFYIKKQLDALKVSNSDAEKEYKMLSAKITVKASHILLKTKKEADDIIATLKKSKNVAKDFVDLAKKHSTGPSATKGGDLGYFTQEQMVPAFSKAAYALKKGNFTKEAIKTKFGFHVIYSSDKKTATIAPLAEIKDKLIDSMKYQRLQASLKLQIEKLKKAAKISIK